MSLRVDLNADLGEGAGGDGEILPLVSSASIACGGHAGDEVSMRECLAAARVHGVAVGAHPSFVDREHFGRREMAWRPEELRAELVGQMHLFARLAREAGLQLRHVKETLELYGCDPAKPSFARAYLLARRMIERGVRFVNLFHEGWDAHSDVAGNSKKNCAATDRASAALVIDLKQRGLLDDTLVIWGGEFGRTPMVETNPALGRALGRDHHPSAFTMWMAGGGVKPGITFGATDELGFHVAENPVHVHDVQATILHLLGFDHEKLTYRFQGRDFRLTDVFGKVVKPILA